MSKKTVQPHEPSPADAHVIHCIKAMAANRASPEQARDGLNWIVAMAARTYDLSYRPDSSRHTDFSEGKRFVGLQIVRLINMKMPDSPV